MGEDAREKGRRWEKDCRDLIRKFGWKIKIPNKDITDIEFKGEKVKIGVDGIYELPEEEKSKIVYSEFKYRSKRPQDYKLEEWFDNVLENMDRLQNSEYVEERVDPVDPKNIRYGCIFILIDALEKESLNLDFYENGSSRGKPKYCFVLDNKYLSKLQKIHNHISSLDNRKFNSPKDDGFKPYLSPFQVDNEIIICKGEKNNSEKWMIFYFGEEDYKSIDSFKKYLHSRFEVLFESSETETKIILPHYINETVSDIKTLKMNAEKPSNIKIEFEELPLVNRGE